MKLRFLAGALLAAAIAGPAAAATPLPGYFPTTIADSSQPQSIGVLEAAYGGQPDNGYLGLRGNYVTFDLGDMRLRDGAGQDFNIYERNYLGSGAPEYGRLDVLVSADNVNFFSVNASIGDVVPLLGVGAPEVAGSYRSFDVGAAVAGLGVSGFRYIKLQGDPTQTWGDGFDLDAIGLVNFGSAVPEPATWAMMITGFGLAGSALRRRKAVLA